MRRARRVEKGQEGRFSTAGWKGRDVGGRPGSPVVSALPGEIEVLEVPAHVAAWSVARIPGFVLAFLGSWRRAHGDLPSEFSLILCPQAEINAMGGLPSEVHALTDPRLRCRHFTGCHRPYLVILFTGDDAESRRTAAQAVLPWSEGYRVSLGQDRVRLHFAEATEGLDAALEGGATDRNLRTLLESGELLRILA